MSLHDLDPLSVDGRGPADPVTGASDGPARAAAVDEARAVFDEQWPRWARAHDHPPRPAPTCDPPRVTLVGETTDDFHHIAVLRFAFEVDGRHFAGFARGPVEAPTFRVWLLHEPQRGGRWWRRGRNARHRPSTVVP